MKIEILITIMGREMTCWMTLLGINLYIKIMGKAIVKFQKLFRKLTSGNSTIRR